MNLVLSIEFNSDIKHCHGGAAANCQNVLESNNIYTENWFAYVILLFAIFIGLRIAAGFVLTKMANKFY